MALYLIKRADGGVSIMSTVADDTDPAGEVAKWSPEDREAVLSIHPIAAKDIPPDRSFRNAWSHQAGSARVHVNMPKARDIHRDALRRQRKPLLDALDVAYMRADEAGNTALKAQLVAEKQELRDVTQDPRIDAATTPGELKAVIPAVLKNK